MLLVMLVSIPAFLRAQTFSVLKHIGPTQGASTPRFITVLNGINYFVANNGIGGDELWRSDGTDAGTVMIKDIYPGINGTVVVKDISSGSAGSGASNLYNFNGTLFFSAKRSNYFFDFSYEYHYSTRGRAVCFNTLYFAAADGVNGSVMEPVAPNYTPAMAPIRVL
ncbi:hypothetical protein A4H97_32885 [Niastella yeongjuensis]|uniref:Uncharacterized protein n=2 Tax=Niastella yeongjuensis TaxID=354355 RepID=A0A1V9EG92_9BACT|nr:hypothetical protein A4H97_32885 [Niastella yeongjuensis]